MSNDSISRVVNGYTRAVRALVTGFETVTVAMKRIGTVITSQSDRPIDQRSTLEERSVKMTLELLQELGSCGDYTRVFRRQFPVETHPDGVEINEENCAEHRDHFPWSWATDVLLSSEGQRRYHEVHREECTRFEALSSEYSNQLEHFKSKHDLYYTSDATGDARTELEQIQAEYDAKLQAAGFPGRHTDAYTWLQAAVFGRLFDQHPELRNPNVVAAQERAVARAEHELIRQHDVAVRDVDYAKSEIERLTAQLPALEAREAELRAQVLPAKARQAAAKAELAAQRVAEAQATAERAQAAADEAKAEAERLAAEAAQSTTGDASDAVAEDKATTATA